MQLEFLLSKESSDIIKLPSTILIIGAIISKLILLIQVGVKTI